MAPSKREVSRLRRRVLNAEERRAERVQEILSEQGPLIRGSLMTRARTCGKPGCRCARGERHEAKCLTVAVQGTVRQVHVPASDEVDVADKTKRYRSVRRARKELAALGSESLTLIDELCVALIKPYPADKPIPPPARRGRPPKKEKGRGRR